MRKAKPTVANKIDNVTKDIPGHFANIYSNLYNSVNDQDELQCFSDNLENKINISCLDDVEKVNCEIVSQLILV